jgi:hypothetical protein
MLGGSGKFGIRLIGTILEMQEEMLVGLLQ